MAKAKPAKKFEAQVVWMAIDKVKPYKGNAKIHDDEQIEKLANLIHKFGFTQPILVDKEIVIATGHGRHLAAKFLGMEKVPVIVADHLNENQIKALRIADNKVSSRQYDKEILAFELGSLERIDFDLELTGMDADEIGDLLKLDDDEVKRDDNTKRSGGNAGIDYDPKTISLIVDPEHHERMLGDLSRLQKTFGVGTNADVVQKLIVYFDSGGVFNDGV